MLSCSNIVEIIEIKMKFPKTNSQYNSRASASYENHRR
jgi:hypothetical protein